jgi:hypothetical protein
VDQLVIDVAGMVEPSLRRPEGRPDPAPQTTMMVKRVIADLLGGKHDPARFTPPMRTFLETSTGKALWTWFASMGELKAVTFADEEERHDGRVIRYRLVLGDDPYWFTVCLSEDGKIAQIRWW